MDDPLSIPDSSQKPQEKPKPIVEVSNGGADLLRRVDTSKMMDNKADMAAKQALKTAAKAVKTAGQVGAVPTPSESTCHYCILSVYLNVCLSVSPSLFVLTLLYCLPFVCKPSLFCLYACLHACLYVCLSVCLPVKPI